MSKLNYKIHQVKGTTYRINITLKDENKNPMDITGATVTLTLRPDLDNDTVLVKTVTTHDDPVNGVTHIKLDPSDTTSLAFFNYLFEIRIEFQNGDIHVPLAGHWEIIKGNN